MVQLVKHTYENKATRYYINSKRVSWGAYDYAIIRLQMCGAKLNSFMTEQCKDGHYKHYVSI